jgi:hypothetical protein
MFRNISAAHDARGNNLFQQHPCLPHPKRAGVEPVHVDEGSYPREGRMRSRSEVAGIHRNSDSDHSRIVIWAE